MINKFIHKTLLLSRLGKRWLEELIKALLDAGRSISYLETSDSSKSDTFHRSIKNTDGTLIRKYFELALRIALKKLKIKRCKIAVDGTEDPYWGENGSFNTRSKVHVVSEESWQYINIAIVEPYFIPLMGIPYCQVDDLDEITIDLIKFVDSLPLEVEVFLFDRGFYHAHLIDFLEGKKRKKSYPYLILVPRNSKIKSYLSLSKDKVNSFEHEFKYSKDKSGWKPKTKIVTCMQLPWSEGQKPIDWCFATNQPSSLKLISIYKKRWNIETGFRIHDECKIKTKSSHPLIRYYYHMFCMLLIFRWRISRISKPNLVFKRFLKWIYLSISNFEEEPT